ncbi:MAG: hypothetical protein GY731_19020, partial [Gammaproteobacteria bacterium]|nr:hypothetical protein [Gammaproteobacteria bacterium]
MFGSAFREVAIGLVFLYLILSLACSAFTEAIAGMFDLRSKNLKAAVTQLLNDEREEGIAKQLFNHHLIRGLARPTGGW